MQKWLLLFFVFTPIASSFSQLVDFYKFQEKEKNLTLTEKMADEKVPGFSTCLRYDDQSEVLRVGTVRRGSPQAVEAHTRFPVGAMSEAPVLFEFLRLSDAGLLSLDNPVTQYLPELKDKRWFKWQPVTIRDLILLRRGLGGPMKPTGYGPGEDLPSLAEILTNGNEDFPNGITVRRNRNGRQRPQYANAVLLQLILERFHDLPLDVIMQERVFGPLGMEHSSYVTEFPAGKVPAIAAGHDPDGQPLPGDYRRYPALAAAGLWTTPTDYAQLVHHVLRAARGEDNRFLSQATALKGLTAQHGYRSLLFLVNKDGGIYWGGNTKGYFTAMQASLKEGYVMVAFCNGDLNWPLVMGALYQSGSWIAQQRKGESLVLFAQPGDEALSADLTSRLAAYARDNQISFSLRDARQGAPASITATPALVFQSPAGRTLFGGRITEWSAIENFIRTARSRPVPPEAAEPGALLVRRDGRQVIGFPLKWTDWPGDAPATDWRAALLPLLAETLRAGYTSDARFFPTDRRFYLDVHPFTKGDSVFLSLAVFSQFDCIHPVYENFGQPIAGTVTEQEHLLRQVAETVAQVVDTRRQQVAMGDALYALPAATPEKDFEALGLHIPARKAPVNQKPPVSTAVAQSAQWKKPRALSDTQPLLQFNFPSPLERYAGEVRRMDGELRYQSGQLSGEFVADLKSLTMGMADLDAKVLKQYLKVRQYADATFSFEPQPMALLWDQDNQAQIQGQLDFLGQEIPLLVTARIRPSSNGMAEVQVAFDLNIARPFGLPGPDGPVEAKERLQFSMQFVLAG